MKSKVVVVLAIAAMTVLATSCEKLKARDQLGKGVQAFKSAQYPQAVERFKTAVELDPTFPTARLYLATAYMMQYVPGAESPENMQMASAAQDQFQKVLDQNPKSKEAYYTLGVIAWTKTFAPRMEVRAKLSMKPEDPGPIKDKKAREELAAKNLPIAEEGIKDLQAALQIDHEDDDAMAYMNLLLREKADLEDSPAAYKKDTEEADNWVQKSLETRKIKAERKPTGGGIT